MVRESSSREYSPDVLPKSAHHLCSDGRGRRGGALAIGVGDRILMLENAWYSVCSPEMCAQILWKDTKKAEEAAESLCLTAQDLLAWKVIDEIIPEPPGVPIGITKPWQ